MTAQPSPLTKYNFNVDKKCHISFHSNLLTFFFHSLMKTSDI